MTQKTSPTIREINDEVVAKVEAETEQAIKEYGLFSSGKLIIDRSFNRNHILSAFYNLPSPPPFHMDENTGYSLYLRFFEISTRKSPPWVIRFIARINEKIITTLAMGSSIDIPLTSVAEFLGFPNTSALSHHSKQIKKWNALALIFYMLTRPGVLFTFLLAIIYTNYVLVKDSIINDPSSLNLYASIIAALFSSLVLSLGFIVAPTRLLARRWDRKYQENICVREALFILFELKNEQAISDAEIRRNIQYRLNRLAYYTLGLAGRFASQNKNNQQWLENHFGQMAAYIQERERWILAPQPTTREQLNAELEKLAAIYISGNYGSFQWDPAFTIQTQPEGWWVLIFKRIGRMLVFLLPAGLMVWMLFNETITAWLGIPTSLLAFLLAAWVLLGIDSALKLGVVSDLLKFAKGLRDLT